MTSQAAPTGRFGAIRKNVWLIVAALGALTLLYLTADRAATMVAKWPPTIHEAVAPVHCDQFIALAKAAYGNNWRVRLDPRDTTCDREVRVAWERQFVPRETPPEGPSLAMVAPQPQALVPVAAAAEVPEPNTYCLNLISLAKAKYGSEWRAKLDPACAQVQ